MCVYIRTVINGCYLVLNHLSYILSLAFSLLRAVPNISYETTQDHGTKYLHQPRLPRYTHDQYRA